MDAMTLLCNLHADGPETRDQLRRAGCGSLADLLALPALELSRILGSTPAFAGRLLREAANLERRSAESSLLEAEEEAGRDPGWEPVQASAVESTPESRPGTPLRPGAVDGLDQEWCRRLREAGVDTVEALVDASLLSLSREWGLSFPRLLELQCRARSRYPGRDLTRYRSSTRSGPSSPIRESSPSIPEPSCAPLPTELPADSLAGLDASTSARLATLGIRTLEALADAPALELSRRLPFPLPRLLDLQYLARRELAATLTPVRRGASVAPVHGAALSTPVATPASERYAPALDAPSGGPFA
jgi:hypothetical protein